MPTTPIESALDSLRRAGDLVGAVDLAELDPSGLDSAALSRITTELRRLQNRCSGLSASVASAAKRCGTDPDATLLGNGRVSGRQARKEARRGEVSDQMPNLGDALRNGDVSGEHVDAVANAADDLDDDQAAAFFRDLDDELAEAASKEPVDTFRRRLRKRAAAFRADDGERKLAEQRRRSTLKRWIDDEGMGHIHITADAERFSKLAYAIEREAARLAAAAKADGVSVRRGPSLDLDALMELIEGAQGPLGRPSITVIIDDDTLMNGPHPDSVCETTAGVPLPLATIRRQACDSLIEWVLLDIHGSPLNVGRTYRTATDAQWTAMKAIYSTCAWFGCERPVDWCQAHHIHEWKHGGATDFANLVPLCSQHHHQVHEGGWRLVMRPDRTLEIHRPSAIAGAPPSAATLWHTTRPDRRARAATSPANHHRRRAVLDLRVDSGRRPAPNDRAAANSAQPAPMNAPPRAEQT